MQDLSRVVLAGSMLLALTAASCKRSQAKNDAATEAEKTYAMVCSRCHGANGNGVGLTPSVTAPRNFRDAAFQKERSDQDLARAIREGKGGMPPFQAVYTAEQIAALVQLIRGFNPEK